MAPFILGLWNNLLNFPNILNISLADVADPNESLKLTVIVASTDSIANSYYFNALSNTISPSLEVSNTSTL